MRWVTFRIQLREREENTRKEPYLKRLVFRFARGEFGEFLAWNLSQYILAKWKNEPTQSSEVLLKNVEFLYSALKILRLSRHLQWREAALSVIWIQTHYHCRWVQDGFDTWNKTDQGCTSLPSARGMFTSLAPETDALTNPGWQLPWAPLPGRGVTLHAWYVRSDAADTVRVRQW